MAYNKPDKKKLRSIAITTAIALSFIALGTLASAQTPTPPAGNAGKSYTLLEPLPCIPYKTTDATGKEVNHDCPTTKDGTVALQKTVDLGTFFAYAFNLFIALSAVAAVAMIVWGGFRYVTSASTQGKSNGLDYFKNAIYGLLMVLCAWIVLKTVNPKLVDFQTAIPVVSAPTDNFNVPTALFDKLNQEAAKYQQLGQKAVDDIKEAKALVDEKLKEKADLQTQIDAAAGDTQTVEALKVEMAVLDGEIKNLQADAALNLAISVIDNGDISQTLRDINLKKLNGTITADQIKKEISTGVDAIEQTRKTRADQLQSLGAYDKITDPGGLNDSAAAAKLTLDVKGVGITSDSAIFQRGLVNSSTFGLLGSKDLTVYVGSQKMGYPSDVYNQLNAQLDDISKKMSTIRDPGLRNDLQTEITNTKQSIEDRFKAFK